MLYFDSVDSQVNSMVKSNVKSRYITHELFGFDIMLDENLKPWIIEVNISPRYVCRGGKEGRDGVVGDNIN